MSKVNPGIDSPTSSASDSCKVMCVFSELSLVGYIVTFEILDSNERFHRTYASAPAFKVGTTYQMVIS